MPTRVKGVVVLSSTRSSTMQNLRRRTTPGAQQDRKAREDAVAAATAARRRHGAGRAAAIEAPAEQAADMVGFQQYTSLFNIMIILIFAFNAFLWVRSVAFIMAVAAGVALLVFPVRIPAFEATHRIACGLILLVFALGMEFSPNAMSDDNKTNSVFLLLREYANAIPNMIASVRNEIAPAGPSPDQTQVRLLFAPGPPRDPHLVRTLSPHLRPRPHFYPKIASRKIPRARRRRSSCCGLPRCVRASALVATTMSCCAAPSTVTSHAASSCTFFHSAISRCDCQSHSTSRGVVFARAASAAEVGTARSAKFRNTWSARASGRGSRRTTTSP